MTYDLVKEEPDEELQEELEARRKELTQELNEFELQMLLSDHMTKTMRF